MWVLGRQMSQTPHSCVQACWLTVNGGFWPSSGHNPPLTPRQPARFTYGRIATGDHGEQGTFTLPTGRQQENPWSEGRPGARDLCYHLDRTTLSAQQCF